MPVATGSPAAMVVLNDPAPALTLRLTVGKAALPVPEPAPTDGSGVAIKLTPGVPTAVPAAGRVAAPPIVVVVAVAPPMPTPIEAKGLEETPTPSEMDGRTSKLMPAGAEGLATEDEAVTLPLTPTDKDGTTEGLMADVAPPRPTPIPVPITDGLSGVSAPTLTVAEGLVRGVATDALTVRPRPDDGAQVGVATFDSLPAPMFTPTDAEGLVPRDATEAPTLIRGGLLPVGV